MVDSRLSLWRRSCCFLRLIDCTGPSCASGFLGVFGFAIKMAQANNPQEVGNFGLWFGELNTSPIRDRISIILDNVLKYSLNPIALPI